MRTTAPGTLAHAQSTVSPSFTPGPWRRLSHRLIAAAPELYEVALMLVEIALAELPGHLHPLFLKARDAVLPAELIKLAAAAVTKVKGGAA